MKSEDLPITSLWLLEKLSQYMKRNPGWLNVKNIYRFAPHFTLVIKSNGRREDFDRDKLERSIRIALQKRPIENERMEQMISGIVRRLESLGETDINSKKIGEIVMEALARIDTVAYVRFASVYKNFQAADDFDKFVSELRPDIPTEE